MRLGRSYFYTMIPLFSDITFLYCIFLIFSTAPRLKTGMMSFYFPGFLACACAAALVNCILARKDRTLIAIAASNAAIAAVTLAVMFSLPNTVSGIPGTIFAALVFLCPAGRSLMLTRNPVTLGTMLSYCEFSIIGTGFFLLAQQGVIIPEGVATRLCVTALILNLIALSALRVTGGKKTVKSGTMISRGLVFAVITSLSFLAAWIMSFLFPSLKDIVLYALAHIRDFILLVLGAIYDFFMFLFSFLSPAQIEPVPQDAMDVMDIAYDYSQDVVMPVPAALLFVLAALAAAGLLFFLFRLRKLRIKASVADDDFQNEKSASPSLLGLLLSALKKLIKKIAFFFWLITHFNTYAGVFIRLEYRGRRLGLARHKSQTPREFLTALADRFAPQSEEFVTAVLNLASEIDMQCFEQKHSSAARKMSREQIRLILSACTR